MTHSYRHPRPAVAVDAVVFGVDGDRTLRVLLIERGEAPHRGRWALPGGFVRIDEDLESAVRRELGEETGVRPGALRQVGAFGAVDRDPRGRVISIAWTALVRWTTHPTTADTDASDANWFPITALPGLAFDHDEILAAARAHLTRAIEQEPIARDLLPPEFTLTQWQHVHEAVLGEPLDKRNFRRWALAQAWVEATGRQQQGVRHRAAQLYRFNEPGLEVRS